MVATQQQRAKLYTALAETMDEEAADTLMDQLPPGGWEQMATKDDLAGLETRLTAAITVGLADLSVKLTEGLAQAATERADINNRMAEGLIQASKERSDINARLAEGLMQAAKERSEGLAQAAKERSDINNRMAEGFAQATKERADIHAQMAEGFAQVTKELADIKKEQAGLVHARAWHLYVIVSTIAAATISIWIALFVTVGA